MLDDTARLQVQDDISRGFAFLSDKLTTAAHAPGLSQRQQRRIKRLTIDGAAGVPYALSRFDVAKASSMAMVDALLAHWHAHRREPDFRYWLGTFCFDDGVINVNDGFLDTAAIKALQHKVYKVLREHDIHAVTFVEVEILMRLSGESSARLMYHVHAVCWRHGERIKPKLLAKTMMHGSRFLNDLGAPSVKFTTNPWPKRTASCDMSPEPIRFGRAPPTASSVAGLAGYVTKWPVCVKVVKPDPRRPSRNLMQADQTKNSARFVLVLSEARSRLSLWDVVGGVGEGSALRKAWKAGVMAQL